MTTVRASAAKIGVSLLKNTPGGKRCPVTLKKTSEVKRKASLHKTHNHTHAVRTQPLFTDRLYG